MIEDDEPKPSKSGKFKQGSQGRGSCRACLPRGGAVKIIVRIEDPAVIETILTHLNKKATGAESTRLPESRTPPQAVLLDGP
jgi:hypothetical protein